MCICLRPDDGLRLPGLASDKSFLIWGGSCIRGDPPIKVQDNHGYYGTWVMSGRNGMDEGRRPLGVSSYGALAFMGTC